LTQSLSHFATTGNYLLIITLTLNSIAKVLLLPLYYAIVGKLSPRKYESIVMGFFFIINAAIGVIVFSLNAKILRPQALIDTYSSLSYLYGCLLILGLGCALIAYLLAKFMRYNKK
jgi:hypothetical protein